jgi:hypothetical protein
MVRRIWTASSRVLELAMQSSHNSASLLHSEEAALGSCWSRQLIFPDNWKQAQGVVVSWLRPMLQNTVSRGLE